MLWHLTSAPPATMRSQFADCADLLGSLMEGDPIPEEAHDDERPLLRGGEGAHLEASRTSGPGPYRWVTSSLATSLAHCSTRVVRTLSIFFGVSSAS